MSEPMTCAAVAERRVEILAFEDATRDPTVRWAHDALADARTALLAYKKAVGRYEANAADRKLHDQMLLGDVRHNTVEKAIPPLKLIQQQLGIHVHDERFVDGGWVRTECCGLDPVRDELRAGVADLADRLTAIVATAADAGVVPACGGAVAAAERLLSLIDTVHVPGEPV